MNRLMSLTPEQTAAMGPWAQEWIARGLRTGKLSEEEWQAWEAAARRCYEYAGIPWPGVVVRVPNPLVGALAAPIAHHVIRSRDAVGGAVGDAVDGAVGDAVGGAVRDAVRDAVRGAVGGAVRDAVRGAVRGAVGGAVGRAVGGPVGGAVDDAVGRAVGGPVGGAVDDAVGGAVGGAVDDAVDDAVGDAVGGAVGDAVHDAVRGAVGDAVDGAVDDAVGGAVGGAVRQGWYYRLGGQFWVGWNAYLLYFRDIAKLELDGDLWDRAEQYAITSTAGWWWPYRDFVMVSDRPTELHLERIGRDGWGSHRLHNETGPSIAWDGYALHHWHGTLVPADLIETGWTIEQILREKNAEVRRCAIERMGWAWFVREAQLTQVGETAADPGNPGQTLTLYDLPLVIFNEPVRVLVCTNATVERDGSRHQFGLTVPGSIPTPIAAAAWTFALNPSEYAQLARAC